MSQRHYHGDVRGYVDKFNCEICQRNKLEGRGCGYLPLPGIEICMIPFEECAVDPIGPWIVQVPEKPYEVEAITVIDTITNLVELI